MVVFSYVGGAYFIFLFVCARYFENKINIFTLLVISAFWPVSVIILVVTFWILTFDQQSKNKGARR